MRSAAPERVGVAGVALLPVRLLLLVLALLSSLHPAHGAPFNYHNYDSLELVVLSPPSVAGNVTYAPGVYGDSILNPVGQLSLELELVAAWPYADACTDLRDRDGEATTRDGRSYAGKAMLIVRGNCGFGLKSRWAQLAGAAVAVIYACSPQAPSLCSGERDQMYSNDPIASLPSLMLNYVDGARLASVLAAGSPVQLSIPGTGPIHPADRAALTAISHDMIFTGIDDTTGGQTGLLPSFASIADPTLDPCVNRVAGIWCVGSPGRIVILDVASANLTGLLSPSIGNLTALQQLSLSNNHFWCTSLHCDFGQLKELRVLNLFNMDLLSFQPIGSNCLDGLTNLMSVDASYNALTEFPQSLMRWTSLRALSVANNAIDDEVAGDMFRSLNRLQYLCIENNDITLDLGGNVSFSVLSNAQYLYLSANRITGAMAEDLFDHMPALVEFDLSNNDISGRLPLFRGTNNVVRADFGGNNFITGNCSAWNMPWLTYLSLGGNNLSEPLERFPQRFPNLQYLDLSTNMITVSDEYDDVGAFLFALMPPSIQTVHLEFNNLAGPWLQTFPSFSSLQALYLGNNMLTHVPDDLFSVGGRGTIVMIDVSYNNLQGALPSLPPSSELSSVHFEGNPLLRSPDGSLPSWARISSPPVYVQADPEDLWLCPQIVGSAYHLDVYVDPTYTNYAGCQCVRGTYGSPPQCEPIPARIVVPGGGGSAGGPVGTFSDGQFGDRRMFEGVDTSFLLGFTDVATPDEEGVRVIEHAGTNRHSVRRTAGNGSPPSAGVVAAPVPLGVVRAIFITIRVNSSLFVGLGESISVYEGVDQRGVRVAFWQGSDPDGSYTSNIDVSAMGFPPGTITVLGPQAVVNFRSSDASGTHFDANYTLSSKCPPGYAVVPTALAPLGACQLPSASRPSAAVIVLLVTSVIIGVLALCLLGTKMSAIAGLINPQHVAGHGGGRRGGRLNQRQQAQEIFGRVLSVEETWRRQLKRDLLKEAVMLSMELAGYGSNWIVVIQEYRRSEGALTQNAFLVVFMCVVALSTATGCISVYARTRVSREIWRELKVGLAVVPTIASLLGKGANGDAMGRGAREETEKRKRRLDARGNTDAGGLVASFGRPLLDSQRLQHRSSDSDFAAALDEEDVETGAAVVTSASSSSDLSMNADMGDESAQRQSGSGRRSLGNRPATGSFARGSFGNGTRPIIGSGSDVNSTISERTSNSASSEEEVQVRLSSKDPNVQLAAVQRSIRTTKLTSWNVLFSTVPFLILNQVRMFEHDDLRSDWVMQMASLFAAMLLGVKLLRILGLKEMMQRRNELVFEVITAGIGGAGGGGNTAGTLGGNNGGSSVYGIGKGTAATAGSNVSNTPSGGERSFASSRQANSSFLSVSVGAPMPRGVGSMHAVGSQLSRLGSLAEDSFASPVAASASGMFSPAEHEGDGGAMEPMSSLCGSPQPAPPGSLAAVLPAFCPLSGGSGSTGAGTTAPPCYLFGPSASFSTVQPLALDDASEWARQNGGSCMLLPAAVDERS